MIDAPEGRRLSVLYLVHRIPYPPNKGDKIRSHRWLTWLAERHDVHLVTLCDDPADLEHIPLLESQCASVHVARLDRGRARVRSVLALVGRQPLSLAWFRDRSVTRAVSAVLSEGVDVAFAFSAPMAAYVPPGTVPVVLDMVDVDSEKFVSYSKTASVPQRWIYAAEGRRLARFEEEVARRSRAVLLCTEPEADLLRGRASDARIEIVRNGADLPILEPADADAETSPRLLFVGALDYLANIDAVTHAAQDILPLVRERLPDAEFHIVGSRPGPEVLSLEELPGVSVFADVPDLRPHFESAAAALVPLRIARGIQNKALEAMAWQLPLITASRVAGALGATPGTHLLVADDARACADACLRVLENRDVARRLGLAGRRWVADAWSWDEPCQTVEDLLRETADARPEVVR